MGSQPNNKISKERSRPMANKSHLQIIDIKSETEDIQDGWKNFVLPTIRRPAPFETFRDDGPNNTRIGTFRDFLLMECAKIGTENP